MNFERTLTQVAPVICGIFIGLFSVAIFKFTIILELSINKYAKPINSSDLSIFEPKVLKSTQKDTYHLYRIGSWYF